MPITEQPSVVLASAGILSARVALLRATHLLLFSTTLRAHFSSVPKGWTVFRHALRLTFFCSIPFPFLPQGLIQAQSLTSILYTKLHASWRTKLVTYKPKIESSTRFFLSKAVGENNSRQTSCKLFNKLGQLVVQAIEHRCLFFQKLRDYDAF